MTPEFQSEHLCMAVDCNAIATMKCRCMVYIPAKDKEEEATIHFCRECYLKQKAMQYENERR